MSSALIASQIDIGYSSGGRGRVVVAKALDLELVRGEVVCLVGPNGVGKSTLLRSVTGLQPLLGGSVEVESEDLHHLDMRARARKIGVVLTDRISVGVLSAHDVVSLGRHPHTGWSGRMTSHDLSVVEWALDAVGATDLKKRNINELSDGERQKIMIARALAQEPSIIVLDEPTAFLDLPRRVEIMGLLKRLVRSTNRAILLSTHDLDLAIRASDRMWLMGPTGEITIGAPEDLILASEFERVFTGDGVAFDRNHGSFHLASHPRGVVAVDGSGLAATWTIRALEREGFRVSGSGEILFSVHIEESDGHLWTLTERTEPTKSNSRQSNKYRSLYDLVRAVRSF